MKLEGVALTISAISFTLIILSLKGKQKILEDADQK
jgi:hypothetical protein